MAAFPLRPSGPGSGCAGSILPPTTGRAQTAGTQLPEQPHRQQSGCRTAGGYRGSGTGTPRDDSFRRDLQWGAFRRPAHLHRPLLSGGNDHQQVGGRLGALVFPSTLEAVLNGMITLASESFTSVSAAIQYAAIHAFNDNREMRQYLQHCRRRGRWPVWLSV